MLMSSWRSPMWIWCICASRLCSAPPTVWPTRHCEPRDRRGNRRAVRRAAGVRLGNAFLNRIFGTASAVAEAGEHPGEVVGERRLVGARLAGDRVDEAEPGREAGTARLQEAAERKEARAAVARRLGRGNTVSSLTT